MKFSFYLTTTKMIKQTDAISQNDTQISSGLIHFDTTNFNKQSINQWIERCESKMWTIFSSMHHTIGFPVEKKNVNWMSFIHVSEINYHQKSPLMSDWPRAIFYHIWVKYLSSVSMMSIIQILSDLDLKGFFPQ